MTENLEHAADKLGQLVGIDINAPRFTEWRQHFVATLGKHVNETVAQLLCHSADQLDDLRLLEDRDNAGSLCEFLTTMAAQ